MVLHVRFASHRYAPAYVGMKWQHPYLRYLIRAFALAVVLQPFWRPTQSAVVGWVYWDAPWFLLALYATLKRPQERC